MLDLVLQVETCKNHKLFQTLDYIELGAMVIVFEMHLRNASTK